MGLMIAIIFFIIILIKTNDTAKQVSILKTKITKLSELIEKGAVVLEEETTKKSENQITATTDFEKNEVKIEPDTDNKTKKNIKDEKPVFPEISIPLPNENKTIIEPETDKIYETHKEEIKQQTLKSIDEKIKQNVFYENAKTILRKIWNWLLVGEEYRSPDMSIEYAIASTWLMRVGITAIILCIGYFLIWSMDKGLLGPIGRISLSIIVGLVMIVFGIKNLKGKYSILGQGFIGGGLTALYFSIYACGPLYNKLSMPAVFALMIFVTICSGILSVKCNSQLVAIFGIIGGFITPILLRTGSTNFLGLYSYMLILGIGILGISRTKNWPLLNYLGFIFTWGIVFGSIAASYETDKHFAVVITGITLFFILHSVIVYMHNLLKKEPCTLLEIIHMLLNAFIYSGLSYSLINEAYGEEWASIMTISLAIFYIAHVYIFLKNKYFDRSLLICLISLASLFTIWTIPLLTNNSTLTVVWSLQALAIIWIGVKLKSNFMIYIAQILYIIVFMRLFIFEIPEQFYKINLNGLEFSGYLKIFLKRFINFGFIIASFFASSYIMLKNKTFFDGLAVDEKQDISIGISSKDTGYIIYWIAIALSFIFLNHELYQCLYFFQPIRHSALTIIWILLGILFLIHYLKNNNQIFLILTVTVSMIIFFKILIIDFVYWNFNAFIFSKSPLDIFMRMIDFIPIFVLLFLLIKITKTEKFTFDYTLYGILSANIVLFIYITLEINTLCHWYFIGIKSGALSLTWSIFAIIYLILGLKKNIKKLRYTGLTLFAIVIFKIFIFDLAQLMVLYRVFAFMIIGIILIAGSFMYIKSSKKFLLTKE